MAVNLTVPLNIAMASRPVKPHGVNADSWQYYLEDVACWIAMKADVLRYGIELDEDEMEAV